MVSADKKIMLPWSCSCFVCGEENEQGMKARSYLVEDRIELPFTAPETFAGWRTAVHGGLMATVLDEVMTWASIVGSRKPCYAAEFKIRMVQPLRPGTKCVAWARMTRNRKRIFDTEAVLQGEDDTVFAKAEGKYMIVPREKMPEFRDDFRFHPDCHDISDVLSE
jgi:acyl-coenzyme A thioesterase PaaI-like protein